DGEREAIRPRRPQSLGYRKWLSLEPRYYLPRGRITDSGSAPARELRVAETHHLIAPEAASEPQECGHEAQLLRLERRLHAGSPYWSNHLVCAGPECHGHRAVAIDEDRADARSSYRG